MCTILLAWRCLDDAAYVLAANRDELLARPSAPPGRLSEAPAVYGGRDLLAGGTWLAVTPEGRLAAVTNRRIPEGDEIRPDPGRRSRGELPLRVLRAQDPREALSAIRPADHNPFDLLLLDGDTAIAGHGRRDAEAIDAVVLEPGPHVLCVHDVDDPSHPRERRLLARLRHAVSSQRSSAACADAMLTILREHTPGDGGQGACVHGDEYGTVSASLVSLGAAGELVYRHAPGPPCVTGFVDVALDGGRRDLAGQGVRGKP